MDGNNQTDKHGSSMHGITTLFGLTINLANIHIVV